MSLKKILLKGTTRISLHERFTYLRNQSPPETQMVHVESVRQGLFRNQQASAKNRRLAQMMDRRPTVMAALRYKKNLQRQQLLRQRLGQGQRLGQIQRLSVKDRLTLRGRGSLRGRIGQRGVSTSRPPRSRGSLRGNRGNRGSLSRSQSFSNLSRSQSIQSLNTRGKQNYNTGRGRGRFQSTNNYNQEYRRGGRGRGFRSRGFNRNGNDFQVRRGGRGVRGGRFNNRGQRSRGFRGRGSNRGFGRGRGRGGRPPTREELDSQLDQYMSGSKGVLDRELDSYMKESWN